MTPLIYLDCCCINRPFDDRRQERVRIEAEAVEGVIAAIENGRLNLLSSTMLLYEISRIPDVLRRRACQRLVAAARQVVPISQELIAETNRIARLGIAIQDAAHLASGIQGGASAFLTVDDQLLRKVRRHATVIPMKVVSPIEFVLEEGSNR